MSTEEVFEKVKAIIVEQLTVAENSVVMDASIFATHVMLAATNYGVDNIWIKLFDKEKIIEEFNLSDNLEPVCLMPLGYRREDYKGSPWHNIRKSLDEIVTYL